MKIAVGIIGLVLSMISLLQSCLLVGASNLAKDEVVLQASSLGMLTALLMFFGAAFAFGLPRIAQVLFGLGFLVSIPARDEYPDMWVWGIACVILGGLLFFATPRKSNDPRNGKGA